MPSSSDMKWWLQKSKDPRAQELQRELRHSATFEPAPADLHDSIMRALHRQSVSAPVSPPFGGMISWIASIAVPLCALCLAAGFLWSPHRTAGRAPHAQSAAIILPRPATAFEARENLAATLPSALLPLSDELTRVQSDLDRTAEFLLASLP
jgi:hypothetical protein